MGSSVDCGECPRISTGCPAGGCLRASTAQQALAVAEPELARMTSHGAVFFLERFKREEKLLGPNEQAALVHAIGVLERDAAQQAPAAETPSTRTYDRLGVPCVQDRNGSRVLPAAQAPAAEPVAQPSAEYKRGWDDCMELWADHMKRMNDALTKPLPEGWANHAHHIAQNVREALAAAAQPPQTTAP